MIETLIYTALTGNADIAARINTRIYPVVMPQNVVLPAVSYQRISTNPINTLNGYSGLKNTQIVINSWGRNYDEVKLLAAEIHSAMDSSTTFHALLINELDGWDAEVTLYVVSHEYSCWGYE